MKYWKIVIYVVIVLMFFMSIKISLYFHFKSMIPENWLSIQVGDDLSDVINLLNDGEKRIYEAKGTISSSEELNEKVFILYDLRLKLSENMKEVVGYNITARIYLEGEGGSFLYAFYKVFYPNHFDLENKEKEIKARP